MLNKPPPKYPIYCQQDDRPTADIIPFRPLPGICQLIILSMLIILIGGGVALLLQYQQGSQYSHAVGDVSVVGPPTVAAATVDAIFARMRSPMVGTGKVVELASRQANIDDAFALGVWWTETNDGAAGVGLAYRNPGSVRGSVGYPSGLGGYTIYPSYTAAILYWFNLLRNRYVASGLSTVYTIARPYVGTTSYPLWAGKVIALMYNYRGMAPPPPPKTTPKVVVTPKPQPKPRPQPTLSPGMIAANAALQHKLNQLLLSQSDDGLVPILHQGLTPKPGNQRSPGTQQANLASVLPLPTEYAIVLFGLLAALAIAFYALKLNVLKGQTEAIQMGSLQNQRNRPELPTTEHLAELSPSTDNLPVLSMEVPDAPEPGLPTLKKETEPLPRPFVFLPAHTDPRAPVATEGSGGTRATGLLSRYREGQK